MSSDSISTEGRIFARQVMRKVKELEPKGAAIIIDALKVKKPQTWEQAAMGLFGYMNPIPVETRRSLTQGKLNKLNARAATKTFRERVPFLRGLAAKLQDEAGIGWHVWFTPHPTEPHSCKFRLHTLTAGDHTFVEMTGDEQAVIVCETWFKIVDGKLDARVNIPIANVSEHALGRLYDRWPTADAPTLDIGFDFIHACGIFGDFLRRTTHLVRSEVNYPWGGLIASGSMKVGGIGNGMAAPFFDVRTVLTRDMLNDEQIVQAAIIALVEADLGDDLEDLQAKLARIPFIERRPDYVMQTVAASKRKPH